MDGRDKKQGVIDAENFVIATGSAPRQHETIAADGNIIMTSDDILKLSVITQKERESGRERREREGRKEGTKEGTKEGREKRGTVRGTCLCQLL